MIPQHSHPPAGHHPPQPPPSSDPIPLTHLNNPAHPPTSSQSGAVPVPVPVPVHLASFSHPQTDKIHLYHQPPPPPPHPHSSFHFVHPHNPASSHHIHNPIAHAHSHPHSLPHPPPPPPPQPTSDQDASKQEQPQQQSQHQHPYLYPVPPQIVAPVAHVPIGAAHYAHLPPSIWTSPHGHHFHPQHTTLHSVNRPPPPSSYLSHLHAAQMPPHPSHPYSNSNPRTIANLSHSHPATLPLSHHPHMHSHPHGHPHPHAHLHPSHPHHASVHHVSPHHGPPHPHYAYQYSTVTQPPPSTIPPPPPPPNSSQASLPSQSDPNLKVPLQHAPNEAQAIPTQSQTPENTQTPHPSQVPPYAIGSNKLETSSQPQGQVPPPGSLPTKYADVDQLRSQDGQITALVQPTAMGIQAAMPTSPSGAHLAPPGRPIVLSHADPVVHGMHHQPSHLSPRTASAKPDDVNGSGSGSGSGSATGSVLGFDKHSLSVSLSPKAQKLSSMGRLGRDNDDENAIGNGNESNSNGSGNGSGSGSGSGSASGSGSGNNPTMGLNGQPLRKPRKPYTITKSREVWTSDEHARFVTALQKFDRDWKKIEQYIGTKTVLQIRSHAQKHFGKVTKYKTGEYIPPPRPKKRAALPYPRSRSTAPSTSGNLLNGPNGVHGVEGGLNHLSGNGSGSGTASDSGTGSDTGNLNGTTSGAAVFLRNGAPNGMAVNKKESNGHPRPVMNVNMNGICNGNLDDNRHGSSKDSTTNPNNKNKLSISPGRENKRDGESPSTPVSLSPNDPRKPSQQGSKSPGFFGSNRKEYPMRSEVVTVGSASVQDVRLNGTETLADLTLSEDKCNKDRSRREKEPRNGMKSDGYSHKEQNLDTRRFSTSQDDPALKLNGKRASTGLSSILQSHSPKRQAMQGSDGSSPMRSRELPDEIDKQEGKQQSDRQAQEGKSESRRFDVNSNNGDSRQMDAGLLGANSLLVLSNCVDMMSRDAERENGGTKTSSWSASGRRPRIKSPPRRKKSQSVVTQSYNEDDEDNGSGDSNNNNAYHPQSRENGNNGVLQTVERSMTERGERSTEEGEERDVEDEGDGVVEDDGREGSADRNSDNRECSNDLDENGRVRSPPTANEERHANNGIMVGEGDPQRVSTGSGSASDDAIAGFTSSDRPSVSDRGVGSSCGGSGSGGSPQNSDSGNDEDPKSSNDGSGDDVLRQTPSSRDSSPADPNSSVSRENSPNSNTGISGAGNNNVNNNTTVTPSGSASLSGSGSGSASGSASESGPNSASVSRSSNDEGTGSSNMDADNGSSDGKNQISESGSGNRTSENVDSVNVDDRVRNDTNTVSKHTREQAVRENEDNSHAKVVTTNTDNRNNENRVMDSHHLQQDNRNVIPSSSTSVRAKGPSTSGRIKDLVNDDDGDVIMTDSRSSILPIAPESRSMPTPLSVPIVHLKMDMNRDREQGRERGREAGVGSSSMNSGDCIESNYLSTNNTRVPLSKGIAHLLHATSTSNIPNQASRASSELKRGRPPQKQLEATLQSDHQSDSRKQPEQHSLNRLVDMNINNIRQHHDVDNLTHEHNQGDERRITRPIQPQAAASQHSQHPAPTQQQRERYSPSESRRLRDGINTMSKR